VPAEALVRHRWSTSIASPDHAAWLLARAKLLAKAADDVKDAIKAACPREGWRLEDGSVLVEGTRNMPRFDLTKLKGLARDAGVTDEQMESCSYVATESAGLKVQMAAGSKPARKRKAA